MISSDNNCVNHHGYDNQTKAMSAQTASSSSSGVAPVRLPAQGDRGSVQERSASSSGSLGSRSVSEMKTRKRLTGSARKMTAVRICSRISEEDFVVKTVLSQWPLYLDIQLRQLWDLISSELTGMRVTDFDKPSKTSGTGGKGGGGGETEEEQKLQQLFREIGGALWTIEDRRREILERLNGAEEEQGAASKAKHIWKIQALSPEEALDQSIFLKKKVEDMVSLSSSLSSAVQTCKRRALDPICNFFPSTCTCICILLAVFG